MGVIKTIVVAFSMFSRIPMPQFAWDEKNMRYMLCAFPLIGAVIGGVIVLWTYLSSLLGFGGLLFAAGITLLPIVITGGIHLDGFCDTNDALASNAPPERRREILKDSHAGAFAIIWLGVYLLAYFGFSAELKADISAVLPVAVMPVLSRCLSGLSVLCFPTSASKGLLSAFRASAEKKRATAVLLVVFVAAAAALVLLGGLAGGAMVCAGLLCMLWLYRMAMRKFGGMSGDLAGFFLQNAELFMLAALVIVRAIIK